MKFLILNTDYPDFLRWLYSQHPALETQPYQHQLQARIDSLFGVADFYSHNLCELGHEAREIFANNEWMQKAWAHERHIAVRDSNAHIRYAANRLRTRLRSVLGSAPAQWLKARMKPLVQSRLVSEEKWFYEVLAAQIQDYRPDVLLNQDLVAISTRFLKEIKPYVRLLVGQTASPLPQGEDFSAYDLVVSSLPNHVQYFQRHGIASEVNRLAFEPRVLKELTSGWQGNTSYPVSFVGSLSPDHKARLDLLDVLCRQVDLKVWGAGADALPPNSAIRRRHQGEAWGLRMYQILAQSGMTVNHHIDLAENYANNMRLFEATGSGALLITDRKDNIHEMFEPDKEVITYSSPSECVDKIRYYLAHESERQAIALSGQARTLREHTYRHRMRELVDLVSKYL